MQGLIGIKLGMTQVYTKEGDMVAVTVVEVPTATVLALKTEAKDGYSAIKLVSGKVKERLLNRAEAGVFKKAGIAAGKHLAEFRVPKADGFEIGKQIDVSLFEEGKKVTITGTSKGRGFAGTIKRHNFGGLPATHGVSVSHRSPGSIGQRQTPGRVFKGKRMSGHMGVQRRTIENLQVVRVDAERNLLLIRGAVPGAPGGQVIVRPSIKAASQALRKRKPVAAKGAAPAKGAAAKAAPGKK